MSLLSPSMTTASAQQDLLLDLHHEEVSTTKNTPDEGNDNAYHSDDDHPLLRAIVSGDSSKYLAFEDNGGDEDDDGYHGAVASPNSASTSSPMKSETSFTTTASSPSSTTTAYEQKLNNLLPQQQQLQQELNQGLRSWQHEIMALQQASARLSASNQELRSCMKGSTTSGKPLSNLVLENKQLQQQLEEQQHRQEKNQRSIHSDNELGQSSEVGGREWKDALMELNSITSQIKILAKKLQKSNASEEETKTAESPSSIPPKPALSLVWELNRQEMTQQDKPPEGTLSSGNPQDHQQPLVKDDRKKKKKKKSPFEKDWKEVLRDPTVERTVGHLAGLLQKQKPAPRASHSPRSNNNNDVVSPSNRTSQLPIRVTICCQGHVLQTHLAYYSGPLKEIKDGDKQSLLPHGDGSLRFDNGDWYLGEFCEGQMHGMGSFTRTSQSKQSKRRKSKDKDDAAASAKQKPERKVYRGRFLQNQFVRHIRSGTDRTRQQGSEEGAFPKPKSLL